MRRALFAWVISGVVAAAAAAQDSSSTAPATQPASTSASEAEILRQRMEIARLKMENAALRRAASQPASTKALPAETTPSERDVAVAKFRAGEISRAKERIGEARKNLVKVQTAGGSGGGRSSSKANEAAGLRERISVDESYLRALQSGQEPKVVPFVDDLAVGDVGDVSKVRLYQVQGETAAIADLPIAAHDRATRVMIRGVSFRGHVDDQVISIDRTLRVTGTEQNGGTTMFVLEPLK